MRSWVVTSLDASGKTTPLLPKPALYYSPRFSPDGQRLAIAIDDGKGTAVFIADLQRDTMSRVTFTGRANWDPVWAPDGKRFATLQQAESTNFFDEIRRQSPTN